MSLSKAHFLAGLIALSAAGTGFAAHVPVVLQEGAVETTANELSLPAAESGIITVRSCSTCTTQTFYLDKQRQLFVAGHPVSLPAMIAALRSAGNEPVTLHYRRKDQLVTRIVLMTVPKASK